MLTRLAFPLLGLLLASCASAPPAPGTPAAAGPTADSPPASASAAPLPQASASAEPPAHQRPLDLVNGCPHDVKLYYGEQPGDGKGTSATIATGATLDVPRGPDGAVVVWVVDDKGAGLASVHVTRRMRHIKIDAACGRIDAS